MIYDHELRAYTKLFAHHYINSNTKDGQKLIEKQTKQQIKDFKYMFCKDYACQCNSEEENAQMYALHHVLTTQQISLARAIVIRQLYNGDFKSMKKKQFQFDVSHLEDLIVQEQEQKTIQDEKKKLPPTTPQFLIDAKLYQISVSILQGEKSNRRLSSNAGNKSLPSETGVPISFKETAILNVNDIGANVKLFEVEKHITARVGCFEVIQVGVKDYPVLIRKKPDNNDYFIESIQNPNFKEKDSNQVDVTFKLLSKNMAQVDVVVRPVTVVTNPSIIAMVTKIQEEVKIVTKEVQSNNQIVKTLDSANDKWRNIQQVSKATVLDMVEKHMSFNANVTVYAPIIFCPAIGSETAAIVNLGQIKITSDMPDVVTDKDAVFDYFQAKLMNLCIFTIRQYKNIPTMFGEIGKAQKSQLFEKYCLILPSTLQANIRSCFVKNHLSVDKLKVDVDWDSFSVTVSKQLFDCVCSLMQFYMQFIPKTEQETKNTVSMKNQHKSLKDKSARKADADKVAKRAGSADKNLEEEKKHKKVVKKVKVKKTGAAEESPQTQSSAQNKLS